MRIILLLTLLIQSFFASDIPLSKEKMELLQFKKEKIQEDIQREKNSWISPIIFSLSLDNQNDASNSKTDTKYAGMRWSQDLFRSGGIGYTIDLAKATGKVNLLGVTREEAAYLKNIYSLKIQTQRDMLRVRQSQLTLKNRDIDLFITKAKYKSGSTDISELNRVTIDRDRARTELITVKNTLRNETYELKKLVGNDKVDTIILPDIPMLSAEEYVQSHLELLQYKAQIKSDELRWKSTQSSYLPKFSINASVGYRDTRSDFMDYSGDSYSYGAVLSIPLDINRRATIESGKLQHLVTQTQKYDRQLELEQEYALRYYTILDYREKIAVADEMLKMFDELHLFTQNQVKVGFKSSYDLESLGNSVEIQKLEKGIQEYNVMIEKIQLYYETNHEDVL